MNSQLTALITLICTSGVLNLYIGSNVFLRRHHYTNIAKFAILLIPLITIVMVITNDIHHLHYRILEVDPILGAPFVHQEIGIWYVVHGVYTFASMFIAFFTRDISMDGNS